VTAKRFYLLAAKPDEPLDKVYLIRTSMKAPIRAEWCTGLGGGPTMWKDKGQAEREQARLREHGDTFLRAIEIEEVAP
jgi:hypothetical protein